METQSRAAQAILHSHPEGSRLTWAHVKALADRSLFGDVLQDDAKEALAIFRGPLKDVHIGDRKVIFKTIWLARRDFPTDSFVYQRGKPSLFVAENSIPWVDSDGRIHCTRASGQESVILFPREDDFAWKPRAVDQLPDELLCRSLLLFYGQPERVVDRIIPFAASQ